MISTLEPHKLNLLRIHTEAYSWMWAAPWTHLLEAAGQTGGRKRLPHLGV